jgi:hypothetical protein
VFLDHSLQSAKNFSLLNINSYFYKVTNLYFE